MCIGLLDTPLNVPTATILLLQNTFSLRSEIFIYVTCSIVSINYTQHSTVSSILTAIQFVKHYSFSVKINSLAAFKPTSGQATMIYSLITRVRQTRNKYLETTVCWNLMSWRASVPYRWRQQIAPQRYILRAKPNSTALQSLKTVTSFLWVLLFLPSFCLLFISFIIAS